MNRPLPPWSRWLALGAGAMDAATGAGLLLLPGWTLERMGITPPGAEALGFVRFVGVFVGAVGLSYLIAWRRGQERALRAVFDFTRVFRLGAGTFTGVMVFGADWPPAWLAVTFADLGLVVVQSVLLARSRDE
ncbi:hypothetical protein Verru16b_03498 [Lacunisphaera limnophila]|uniref:DUF4345 domain-containing protein n=1 Tax=Lacunisphaera limnophila TaxID=1838286 RepID=A0A1D8AZR4_9BACT|nr:hypothetical protein [Lacunisphaera limnophila]AOS46392.1 hypothetical protein Verru16b_03498 [Lacunisphaera limnophila]